tara:strand:- start:609 stop:2240 length:1632 start_codon:yes stop_codon:yes gene_type:complete
MAVKKIIEVDVKAKEAISQIDDLKKGVKGVDKSSKGAKKGLGGMTGATKMLGTAFKALGIGLIIAAFMKLKDIFSGNIETARKFERISAQLSAAFDVLRDRAEEFIKSLIKLKNPFKAFKDAFTGTTAEIKEEVKAIDTLTIALQGVRDEERDMLLVRAKANKIIAESRLLAEDDTKSMEERLAALKAAVAEEKRVADMEVATQKKKVDTLQAVIDLGKSSEEDIAKLAEERARLIDLQTASVLKQKRVAAEIGTFTNQIAKQDEKNEQDRLKRIELINKAQELNLEITEDISNKQIEELIKKTEKAEAETQKQLELVRISGLSQQELEIEQATTKYNALIKLAEKYGKDTTKITEQFEDKKLEINKKYSEAEVKVTELTQEQKTALVAQSLGTVANIIGKESAAGKALAVAQALINTYSAAAAALAPPPTGAGPIFGPIAAAGAVASGLKTVKDIMSVALPEGDMGMDSSPSVSPTPGGGSISSDIIPTPSLGGIGGASLIPNIGDVGSAGLGMPPVQAYVVENDISSSQALQQELELQATL